MNKSKKQVSTFVLEGRFLDALGKSPVKPKYLRIATSEGEQLLKLSKELRPLLTGNQLPVGTWITVSGTETYKPKEGKRKRKIYAIKPQDIVATAPSPQPPSEKKKSKKEKILVCQKSSCCKRGGKAVYQAAIETIEKHELGDQVQVQATGCMGKCKNGPCLVMQGDKSRHLGLKPEQVRELIAQQYSVFVS